MENPPRSAEFGRLLQEYRLRAGLTQEVLAERAGLGRRSVQGLERGENQPRRETIQSLVSALALLPSEQARLTATARRSPRDRSVDLVNPIAAATSGRSTRFPSQSLPGSLTSFVGRDQEMVGLRRLLASSRLLTLTGPPGTGKTRLAVEAAREAGPDFVDGVCFVPLAPLADPDLVLSAVRQRLGLAEIGGRPLPEVLATYFQGKSFLLVLDNFEQVASAATRVGDLLGACPGLQVLVTSRTALHVRGEQVFPVPPLAVPDPATVASDAAPDRYPSVRLFVERARAVKPEFTPGDKELQVVGEICRRLDGLPLAIELAAARSAILSPPAILARLKHPLVLLTGGARDLPARQQTLRAAIAWSDKLLEPIEQRLFRRLAVFAGGWGLEAAAAVSLADEEVLPAGPLPPSSASVETAGTLDRLESLVDQGLLQLEDRVAPGGDAEPRFGMLETLREYATEQLVENGELEALRQRHAVYFLALAEETGPKVYGSDSKVWLDRLERDHDNFRAALRWAEEHGDGEMSLRLGAALYRFWWLRAHGREGKEWLARALNHEVGRRPEDDRRSRLARAQALHAAGIVAQSGLWDDAAAQPLHEESLGLMRVLGDRRGIANSLHNLATVVGAQGDFTRAWPLFEESLGRWRQVGEQWGITAVLRGMASLALTQGDNERARLIAEECLGLARGDGFPFHIANVLGQFGVAALGQGDRATARARLEESLALYREVGPRRNVAWTLCFLAQVMLPEGNDAGTTALLAEALSIYRELELPWGVAHALKGFATLAMSRGYPERAFRLAGAASALRNATRSPESPTVWPQLDHDLGKARDTLGDTAAAAAWAEGQAMTLEQAVADALGDGDR